jgi:hypothetical protein
MLYYLMVFSATAHTLSDYGNGAGSNVPVLPEDEESGGRKPSGREVTSWR